MSQLALTERRLQQVLRDNVQVVYLWYTSRTLSVEPLRIIPMRSLRQEDVVLCRLYLVSRSTPSVGLDSK